MIRRLPLISFFVALLLLLVPMVALGAYSNYITVTVFNNGTETYGDMPVLVSVNNTQLYNLGYINATGLNTNLLEGSGGRVYMVATPRLGIYAPSMAPGQVRTYYYRLADTTGQTGFPVMVGVDGNVTASDSSSSKLGLNWTATLVGYFDMDAAQSKNSINKPGAIRLAVNTTESNVLTATIAPLNDTPEASASTTGTSVNPNSASLTPTWGTGTSTLWFTTFGLDGTDAPTTVTSYPAGYSNGRLDYYGTSLGVGVGSARKTTTAASDDPGQFVVSRNEDWVAYTVGVGSGVVFNETGGTGGDNTNQTVSLPSPTKEGDLLLIFLANDGGATVTTPTGWTQLFSTVNGVAVRFTGLCRVADGTEGLTQSITLSAAESIGYTVYLIRGGVSVTALGITSGHYPVQVSSNATFVSLSVDGVQYDQAPSVSVPDNTNGWTFMGGNSMVYLDSLDLSVNGTSVLHYEPTQMVSPTNVVDTTGNGNTGTINWGTNPTPIEVTIGGLTPFTLPEASVAAEGDPQEIFTIPDGGIDFYEDPAVTGATLPFAVLFEAGGASLGWSLTTTYGFFMVMPSIIMAFAGAVATGSLFVGVLFGVLMLGMAAGTGIIPAWLPVSILVLIGALIFAVRRT